MIEKRFEEFLEKEELLKEDSSVLLAVSGGVDSVVMADLFHRANINFAIAHCNFQLRGKESDGDEQFAERLAKKYSVVCFTTKFDTKKFSRANKFSTQEAARKLRYNWFEEVCMKHDIDLIGTAHHLNDSIETFFINLLRGTGIEGLKGIPFKNGRVIRPLLSFTRKEIEAYAKKRKLKFREDSSNNEDDYLRNKIRHKLIPVLRELNPKFEVRMQQTMENIQLPLEIFSKEVLKSFSHLFEEENKKLTASISQIKTLPQPAQYLYYLLKPMNFNIEAAEEILQHHQSGKRFYSGSHILTIDRDLIIIEEKSTGTLNEGKIEEGQKTFTNSQLQLDFTYLLLTTAAHEKIPSEKNIHWVDASLLKFPLHIRKWKPGDSFIPLGMKGKKKVSDFFIDRKIPLPEKEKTCVLLSGSQIVCILGQRIDERFKVTDKTRKIFCIEVHK
jgi:tRNA(Ile)-lysidine synthase